MSILNKLLILELNKSWIPITIKTPKTCFENFYSNNLFGLDIVYSDESVSDGSFETITSIVPARWEEWITLPVREYDLSISTARGKIRVPNIVICAKYNQFPGKTPRLSKKNVLLRDGFMCQYTGKEFPRNELNIDHIVPQSRGGGNTWENLVTCHRDINTMKGDRTPEEAGLHLIRSPKTPSITQIFFAAKQRDPKWKPFLKIYDN